MADNNKVKYGLKNVHYAIAAMTNGAITYNTPVAIPGAVNLNLSAEGDMTPFRADNIDYWITGANNGYSGDLEIAIVPDSFRVDALGEVADTSSGLQYEIATAQPVPFALMFEFDGDANATRHVLYNCKAARPALASETTPDGNIEPITETLSITAKPRETDNLVKAKATTGTAYSSFFTSVQVPTIA